MREDESKSQSKPESASAKEAPAAERIPSKAETIVDEWFAKHFHDLGPKLSTELHNIIHAAKEDLKKLLSAL